MTTDEYYNPDDDGDYSPEAVARYYAGCEPSMPEIFSKPLYEGGILADCGFGTDEDDDEDGDEQAAPAVEQNGE